MTRRLSPADLPRPIDGLRYEIVSVDAAPRLNAFFNDVFGQQRPDPVAAWKYFGAEPSLPAVAIATEIDGGRIVAMHPSVVRRLWARGQEHRIYQIADVAIAADVRRGIQLYKQFVLWVQWTGVIRHDVLFGYGGLIAPENRKIGKRLVGYQDLFAIPAFDRRLSLRASVRRRLGGLAGATAHAVGAPWSAARHGGRRHGFFVEPFAAFDDTHDALWARLRDRYEVALVRDRAVLDWRYGRNPAGPHRFFAAKRGGELAGWAVLRHWDQDGIRFATLLDCLDGHDPELASALVQAASAEARRAGCDFLRVAPQPGSALARSVASLPGFRPGRALVDHVVFKTLPPDPAAYGAAELARRLEDPARWHYAQGDSDYLE
ncbi:MAG TPA: hypothetical protein VGC54_01095 [Planctomycetota bacterium]